MICSSCGKSVSNVTKFCPHCGGALNAPPNTLTCLRCGGLSDGAGAFCSHCGFPLRDGAKQVPDTSSKGGPRTSLLVGTAILIVILCSVFFWHEGAPASDNGTQEARATDTGSNTPGPTSPTGGTGTSPATRQPDNSDRSEPPLAAVFLHPNELIKDPFSNRGKRIRLDVTEYPVLFEKNLIRYMMYTGPPGIGEQLTPRGVRFKKMFSPTDQLYDVTAVSQGGYLSHGTTSNEVVS